MKTPRQLKKMYENNQNISAFLRRKMSLDYNSTEIIEISYDLQTGSYVAAMEQEAMIKHKSEYSREIASTILSLCKPESILEAGIGEATTMSGVLKNIGSEVKSYGFDLSWSRVAYAQKWLHKNGIKHTRLCSGDLFNIPFLDNSIDIVYTSHSIEPNGGNEEAILRELYRIARKYVILLEPGYEFATNESKKRMESHGYCKDLKGISEFLGYDVLESKLFPYSARASNPTAITIIRKEGNAEKITTDVFACPKFKTPLLNIGGMMYSPEALVVYPVIADIPCLRRENGIFASKYSEIMEL